MHKLSRTIRTGWMMYASNFMYYNINHEHSDNIRHSNTQPSYISTWHCMLRKTVTNKWPR